MAGVETDQAVYSRKHREGVATMLRTLTAEVRDLREVIEELVAAQPRQHTPQRQEVRR